MSQRRRSTRESKFGPTGPEPDAPRNDPASTPAAAEPASPRSGDEIVDEASRESMAGSDPPSFTPGTATRADPEALAAAPDEEMRRRIRRRAYEIWDFAGRPVGHEMEHWLQAEAEVRAMPAERPREGHP